MSAPWGEIEVVAPGWGAFADEHVRNMAGGLLRFGCTPLAVAPVLRGRLVYLATPYSREVVDGNGQWCRDRSQLMLDRALRASRALCVAGVCAVSPIVLSAPMCHGGAFSTPPGGLDPLDAAFWEAWCRPLLHAAQAVVVPDIPGWNRSLGVWHEVQDALARNVPVFVYAGLDALEERE